ncbi:flotillin family protein [Kineococcus gynurae]|uniref:Flotillin family protein n=1 Tax=Kineococcus gynurae TaxID=452979 RepID=A0ABV5LMU6_9ACTN
MEFLTPTVILVAAAVVVVLLLSVAIVRRYRIAGPSEAFIVTGKKGKPVTNPETGKISTDLSGQKVVMGGGIFVLPFVQQAYSLSLASRRISVQIRGAVSGKGIRLNLDGVAIIKVGGTEDSVRAAAQRFLHQQDEIESFTQEVLAGSLRSIVGTLTVDEIIRDRAAFASRVAEEAETSLTNQGLVLDTFQIQDVTDEVNYLRDLGRPEAAIAAQNAAIAEANSLQESQQAEARAQEGVAGAQRDLALRQAEFKAETDTAQAKAAAAGVLAKAARDQEVLVEQERVAERQAALTERQLDTEVRKPADARRYDAEQQAQARRNSEIFEAEAKKAGQIANAEAEARRVELSAQAEANRVRLAAEADAQRVRVAGEAELDRRRALAEATRLEGEAEGAAIRARGEAEAETMRLRAEAFEQYGEAALAQMVVDVLPQVARELAAPMSAISDLTVISTDGASQLSHQVGRNLTETLEIVRRTTGLDVQDLLRGWQEKSSGSRPASTPTVVPRTDGAPGPDRG